MTAVSLRLPLDLYSPDQLSTLILELTDLAQTLRSVSAQAKLGSKKPDSLTVTPTLKNLLQTAGKPISVDSAESLAKTLSAIRRGAPTVHVGLPAWPERTLKRQLTVWFRSQVHPHTLLIFAVKPGLCGGMTLQTSSRFWDFSFREPIINSRSRIAELLGNV